MPVDALCAAEQTIASSALPMPTKGRVGVLEWRSPRNCSRKFRSTRAIECAFAATASPNTIATKRSKTRLYNLCREISTSTRDFWYSPSTITFDAAIAAVAAAATARILNAPTLMDQDLRSLDRTLPDPPAPYPGD